VPARRSDVIAFGAVALMMLVRWPHVTVPFEIALILMVWADDGARRKARRDR
jgi:hypothetical protein